MRAIVLVSTRCRRWTDVPRWSYQPFSSAPSKGNNSKNALVRLSKRMSELDICSRREADRYILEGRVAVNGKPVDRILGQKVDANETNIVLFNNNQKEKKVQARPLDFDWSRLQTAAVVLHKPMGYVTGQPEGAKQPNNNDTSSITTATPTHIPAVRLLTPANAHVLRANYQSLEEYQQAQQIVQEKMIFDYHHRQAEHPTLQNYVPAGRLDLDSSGLLIFTNQGVLAKKLISDQGTMEKEYWVVLEPAQGLTNHEKAKGMTELPSPNRNLKTIRRGGYTLFGDIRPLRPVVQAEWLSWEDPQVHLVTEKSLEGNARRKLLRIVLKEGRKHQIRRMCRELLGMHVVQLVRTRIGPIELNLSLPEGMWRPLRRQEMEAIFFS